MLFTDWVRESSVTSGTGTMTLTGAVTGFAAFAVVNTSGRVKYTIYEVDFHGRPTGVFEVGIGVYTYISAGNTTLTRDVVIASSNSGSLVSFSPVPYKYVEIVADSTESNTTAMFFFGDGNSGTDITITSSGSALTLTSDLYCRNLTISGTGYIITNGWSIYVSDVLDISNAQAGAIQTPVYNGNNAVQPNGGIAASYNTGMINTVGGGGSSAAGANAGTGIGANGSAADSTSSFFDGGHGGNGGQGGIGTNAGGYGGQAGTLTPLLVRRYNDNLIFGSTYISGGSGGSGGGAAGGNGASSGGAGGGGGVGGGVIAIYARIINRSGSTAAGAITAKGGTGGNGSTSATSGNLGGGAGGGGGGGGWVYIAYQALMGTTATNCLDASSGVGGAGANASTGATTAVGGQGGVSGDGGRITVINLSQNTTTETVGSAGNIPSYPGGTTGSAGGAAVVTQANL